MFCTRCGIELDDKVCYCSQCGTATGNAAPPRPQHAHFEGTLSRPLEGKKIAGVCAGFARYLGVDVTLVRIVWLVLAIWPPGVGLIAYFVCLIAMPKDPAPVAARMDAVKST